jgi:hypothetical protein
MTSFTLSGRLLYANSLFQCNNFQQTINDLHTIRNQNDERKIEVAQGNMFIKYTRKKDLSFLTPLLNFLSDFFLKSDLFHISLDIIHK